MRRHRKWPRTAHWQRVESTFRSIHGKRWRRCAASAMRCEKRDLRALVDRDLSGTEIRRIDACLIDRLHRYATFLRRQADDVCDEAKEVMRATNEVSTLVGLSVIRVDIDTTSPTYGTLDPGLPPMMHAAWRYLMEDA